MAPPLARQTAVAVLDEAGQGRVRTKSANLSQYPAKSLSLKAFLNGLSGGIGGVIVADCCSRCKRQVFGSDSLFETHRGGADKSIAGPELPDRIAGHSVHPVAQQSIGEAAQ